MEDAHPAIDSHIGAMNGAIAQTVLDLVTEQVLSAHRIAGVLRQRLTGGEGTADRSVEWTGKRASEGMSYDSASELAHKYVCDSETGSEEHVVTIQVRFKGSNLHLTN